MSLYRKLSTLEFKFLASRAYPIDMQTEHFALNPADHNFLITLTAKGQPSARVFKRATALLALHRGQTLRSISETLQVSYQSVANWRNNYQASGLQALHDKPRSSLPIEIDGKQRACLTALACSTPPAGRARWTLRLLADKAVELGHFETLSHTAARKILKKRTAAAPEKTWCIGRKRRNGSSSCWKRRFVVGTESPHRSSGAGGGRREERGADNGATR